MSCIQSCYGPAVFLIGSISQYPNGITNSEGQTAEIIPGPELNWWICMESDQASNDNEELESIQDDNILVWPRMTKILQTGLSGGSQTAVQMVGSAESKQCYIFNEKTDVVCYYYSKVAINQCSEQIMIQKVTYTARCVIPLCTSVMGEPMHRA